MNFEEVKKLAKKDKVKLDGVLDLETIKNMQVSGKYFIYFIQPEKYSVGHYVVLIRSSPYSFYCDSYGNNPTQECIDFLGKPIKMNNTKFQKFNTANCGAFCVEVLKEFQKTGSFEETLEKIWNYIICLRQIHKNNVIVLNVLFYHPIKRTTKKVFKTTRLYLPNANQ